MQSGKKERILITGGGGWFGQNVAKEMLDAGYDIILLDIHFVNVIEGQLSQYLKDVPKIYVRQIL